MLFELLSELMTTLWGQIAVIGTSVSVLSVWLLWAWEATVVDSKERVNYVLDLPPAPYVKVSFRTFENPFQIPKLNEATGWDVWCDVEWAIRSATSNAVTMICEAIFDFILWSKAHKMLYIGTFGFAGTYYGGFFIFTNPTIVEGLKSIGTAPYLLATLIMGVVVWELTSTKGENDERESTVEV